jgi:methionyl aminopeptidase
MAKRKFRRAPAAPKSLPPVLPALIGPRRTVPREIPRPPYALTGDPGRNRPNPVRSPAVIDRMRIAGRAAAEILVHAGRYIEPGLTTDKLDAIVHEKTLSYGGYPSPLNYRGFPKSVCTSINEVICHGIPDSRPLANGDIVNVDVTIYLDGVHGDTSATFAVGDIDEYSAVLVRETRNSLYRAIDVVKPGVPINEIGRAIENHARKYNLGVVREFIGHGIGEEFHGVLQIPHYYDSRARTILEEGMTFTIEPMLTLGDPALGVWDDDWTAVTLDGRRSAQFEHMLVVTADGCEVLTVCGADASGDHTVDAIAAAQAGGADANP